MHIWFPTDVFPPGKVGGTAWSTLALAQGLTRAGHTVRAIVPDRRIRGTVYHPYADIPAWRWGYHAGRIPFVQNYQRHERVWAPLARTIISLVTQHAAEGSAATTVLHAQHVQTAPATVMAARRLGVPCVVTVRDHWPWDYFAVGLHGGRVPYRLRRAGVARIAGLATDLLARADPLRGALSLLALPYIASHLQRRAEWLAQADAVIAVSNYMADALREIVPAHKLHVIHHFADSAAIMRAATPEPEQTLPRPFLLFVGKLERNKGADLLIPIIRSALAYADALPTRFDLRSYTLLIAGDGALRTELEQQLAATGMRVEFLRWIDHDTLLQVNARASLLLFPSGWGEPFSRTPLDSGALAVPCIAMPTGGTPDLIEDGVNGVLASTPELFARKMVDLLRDPERLSRMGRMIRQMVQVRFGPEQIVPQVVRLYEAIATKH